MKLDNMLIVLKIRANFKKFKQILRNIVNYLNHIMIENNHLYNWKNMNLRQNNNITIQLINILNIQMKSM